jgi:hypothetical protein
MACSKPRQHFDSIFPSQEARPLHSRTFQGGIEVVQDFKRGDKRTAQEREVPKLYNNI